MRRALFLWLIGFAYFTSTVRGDEGDALASIKKGKAATVIVVLPGERGFGSAFCLDGAGFFITNERIVRGLTVGKTVSLVLNPGEDAERVAEATLVRADTANDLALLRVTGQKNLATLDFG